MDSGLARLITLFVAAAAAGGCVAYLRRRLGPAAEATGPRPPRPRTSRKERKAAAKAGTTQVLRPDLAEAERRVLAAAARLAGEDRPAAPQPEAPAEPEARTSVPSDETSDSKSDAPAIDDTSATSVATSDAYEGPSLFLPEPGSTVAEVLEGIRLPLDLTPLTTMAPRPDVRDRVAFVTVGPAAEVVAPAMTTELQRLGFAVVPQGYDALAISRGNDRALVVVHPRGDQALIDGVKAFPSAPPRSVVVEIWLPAGL